MRIHGVGTLLVCGDQPFMVCGYRFIEQDERLLPCYVMVPYPLGYINENSLSLVDATINRKVIATGLNNDAQTRFNNALEEVCLAKNGMTLDEYLNTLDAVRSALLEGGDDDE